MPRLYDDAARAERDQRLLGLYLQGFSYREIAAQPGVGLSLRGVVKAVHRQLYGLEEAVLLGAFGDAYDRACAGDESGKRAMRRALELLPPPVV